MTDVACEIHGSATRTADGRWLCCAQEELDVFPASEPTRSHNPPPPNFRELVDAHRTRPVGEPVDPAGRSGRGRVDRETVVAGAVVAVGGSERAGEGDGATHAHGAAVPVDITTPEENR